MREAQTQDPSDASLKLLSRVLRLRHPTVPRNEGSAAGRLRRITAIRFDSEYEGCVGG